MYLPLNIRPFATLEYHFIATPNDRKPTQKIVSKMTAVEPITTQPTKGQEMEKAAAISIGLRELLKTDKIVIQQMGGLIGSCCCYEGENIFEISDRLGHVILRAKEESSCLYRQCCERLRPFEMEIKDRQSRFAIRVTRPWRLDNCFCCPCLNQVSLFLAPNVILYF